MFWKKRKKRYLETRILMLIKTYLKRYYLYIYTMGCHPKNTEYQKRWRELNRDKYLKQNVKGVLKYYYYKKGIKELMNIDPTLFL